MKQFCFLLVAVITMCTAAYGQGEGGASQSPAFHFDQEHLLNRLAALKPFKSDKGEAESKYAFVVTQEEFRKSLIFLSKEEVDVAMDGFVGAAAFSFEANTQFLMLTQWQDQEAARKFIKVEDELWRLKDKEYQQFLKKVVYEEIDIAEDEKALLTRKTIQQGEQKQAVTTFVSARGKYLFECTLIGDFTDREVKKLILQIWDVIESEEKKGAP
jgi:hypothetical protein